MLMFHMPGYMTNPQHKLARALFGISYLKLNRCVLGILQDFDVLTRPRWFNDEKLFRAVQESTNKVRRYLSAIVISYTYSSKDGKMALKTARRYKIQFEINIEYAQLPLDKHLANVWFRMTILEFSYPQSEDIVKVNYICTSVGNTKGIPAKILTVMLRAELAICVGLSKKMSIEFEEKNIKNNLLLIP
uniref:Uncharacterized protein n=1 Tax=Glossina pallidipes TaxID=7398 RepID=A0A1B0A0R5_GLOPL